MAAALPMNVSGHGAAVIAPIAPGAPPPRRVVNDVCLDLFLGECASYFMRKSKRTGASSSTSNADDVRTESMLVSTHSVTTCTLQLCSRCNTCTGRLRHPDHSSEKCACSIAISAQNAFMQACTP